MTMNWGSPATLLIGGYPYWDLLATECAIGLHYPLAKILGVDTSRHELVWENGGQKHGTRIGQFWGGHAGYSAGPDPLAEGAEEWFWYWAIRSALDWAAFNTRKSIRWRVNDETYRLAGTLQVPVIDRPEASAVLPVDQRVLSLM
jgi:hypothetical protein